MLKPRNRRLDCRFQLGFVLSLLVAAPSSIAAPPNGATLASGGEYTCAVFKGSLKCWGANANGQLGNGTSGNVVEIPVQVTNLTSSVTAVAAGPVHSCAVMNGKVYCWGANRFGQLGNGTTEMSRVPVEVTGLPGQASQVAVGTAHSCAIVDSDIYCWGNNKFLGQYEQPGNLPTGSLAPVKVQGLDKGATGIAAGNMHTCAIVNGSLYCWGLNNEGQLGLGHQKAVSIPQSVKDMIRVSSVSAALDHTCAVADGSVYCWGNNQSGELGNTLVENSSLPVHLQTIDAKMEMVSVGGHHACAINHDSVMCWGENRQGQLGRNRWISLLHSIKASLSNSKLILPPAPATEVKGEVVAMTSGENHSCVVYKSSAIKCWGANTAAELGSPSKSIIKIGRGTQFSSEPLPVVGLN